MISTDTNLLQNLVHIHRVITRALIMDIVKGANYMRDGFPSPQEQLGYARFNHCLVSVFCSHQQAEDLVAFPAFRKAIPAAPFEQFKLEHERIEALLALIPELLKGHPRQPAGIRLGVLLVVLRRISRVWASHIELEEQVFSDISRSPAVELTIRQEIGRNLDSLKQDRSHLPRWTVPFLLFDPARLEQVSLASSLAMIPPGKN